MKKMGILCVTAATFFFASCDDKKEQILTVDVAQTSSVQSEHSSQNSATFSSTKESIWEDYCKEVLRDSPQNETLPENSEPEITKLDKEMLVQRQKYAKKEPYPDAERGELYLPGYIVHVEGLTETGYYKLDSGEYIKADCLYEESEMFSIELTTVNGIIPSSIPEKSGKPSGYNRIDALQYASAHWNKDESLCAEFAAECLTAGGIPADTASSTALFNMFMSENIGFSVLLPLNDDGTASAPDFLKPGDLVFYYCASENMLVHTAVYCGATEDGLIRAYAHNPQSDGVQPLKYYAFCPDGCNFPLKEIAVFSFYDGT